MSSSTSKRPGVMLVMVMGLVFLMGLVLVQILDLVEDEIKRQGILLEKSDLKVDAYGALETTLAWLAETEAVYENLNSPKQWGGLNIYEAQGLTEETVIEEGLPQIEVSITDETGKIPLRKKDEPLLRAFFNKPDINFSDASTLVDSLLDWTEPGELARINGAKADFYESRDPAYKPPLEPLRSFKELSYIQGFEDIFFEDGKPSELYDEFVASFSLYHDALINLNTAPESVLKAMAVDNPEIVPETILSITKATDNASGNSQEQIIETGDDIGIPRQTGPRRQGERAIPYGYEAKTLKITIKVLKNESTFLLSCIVKRKGTRTSEASAQSNFEIVKIAEGVDL